MVAIMQHEQGQTTTERYNAFSMLAAGEPLKLRRGTNPCTEDQVDPKDAHRGRLLIGHGGFANTVPWAIATASFKTHAESHGATDEKVPDRGNSITSTNGWRGWLTCRSPSFVASSNPDASAPRRSKSERRWGWPNRIH
jgi:hypothetical protein